MIIPYSTVWLLDMLITVWLVAAMIVFLIWICVLIALMCATLYIYFIGDLDE